MNIALRTRIPSVDELLRNSHTEPLILRHGRGAVKTSIQATLAQVRSGEVAFENSSDLFAAIEEHLRRATASAPKRVLNLTGVILHTNLGRAPLPASAVDAMADVARHPCNLEYDLASGTRGDRDDHTEQLIRSLTGAEAATVVNNNAAAVLLALNTLALRKDVLVSRGELIEIGGAFRLPEIMRSAGSRLKEIGTTNRTHLRDYESELTARTAAVMKVHTSNYVIHGFTASVPVHAVASVCRTRGIPLIVDLGSGNIVDLRPFGLAHEPTVCEVLQAGADVVTFSGDKLLGGPQAGIIAGRRDLIARMKKNPLRRALRVDKVTIAALAEVLKLQTTPEHLPALRLATTPISELHSIAESAAPEIQKALGEAWIVEIRPCDSEMGSGALPETTIDSVCISIRRSDARRHGAELQRLAGLFRELPIPVIGRICEKRFLLDLRSLDDAHAFLLQMQALRGRT